MRIIENRSYARRSVLGARMRRLIRTTVVSALAVLQTVWTVAFPFPPPDRPTPPSPIAKPAALQQGALLSEAVDAVAKKHVA